MIKHTEMHNFKDPQNKVWDNADLETCEAGETVMEVMAWTKNQAWNWENIKLQIIKDCKNQILQYLLTNDFTEFFWLVRSKFTECIIIVSFLCNSISTDNKDNKEQFSWVITDER